MISWRRIGLCGGIGVLVAAIFIGGYAHRALIVRRLDTWKLLPRPERLTELYFDNITGLPTKITPATPQPVGFVVHNLEARTVEYHYVLRVASLDGKIVRELGNGSFRLEANHTLTTTSAVAIPALSRRVQVQVRLRYGSIPWGYNAPVTEVQQINFWAVPVIRTP